MLAAAIAFSIGVAVGWILCVANEIRKMPP